MAAVRRNVVTDQAARNTFAEGVVALKNEFLGPTTADFGISGPAQPVSTYDLFIAWHHLAMGRMTPPGQTDRNAAHSGPVFLPWHRLMLLLFELQLQRVLGDPDVGLPYWDWAADGDLPVAQQRTAPLWRQTGIGGSGNPVPNGPFRPSEFRVRIESISTVQLRATDRGLRRAVGNDPDFPALPTTAQVKELLDEDTFDSSPWDRSTTGFRNRVEGWVSGPAMHNLVHVWVGGDMGPASSPNDPVFYLNHCNVDRLWEAWMTRHGRVYVPPASAAASIAGHRIDDALYNILVRQRITPAMVLDLGSFSTYDVLP